MRKSWIILSATLLLFALMGVPQYAQEAAAPDPQRRALVVGLVQAIGTVEGPEKAKNGSYADWPTLRGHHGAYLDRFIVAFRQQLHDASWGDPPEVLPGLSLRMNVHADGQGYDIWLEDITDKKCGFAVFTDETVGGIRQTVKYDLLAFGSCHIPVEK